MENMNYKNNQNNNISNFDYINLKNQNITNTISETDYINNIETNFSTEENPASIPNEFIQNENLTNEEIETSNIDTFENNIDENSNIVENDTSNCFALTIKEDYKLTSKTNRIMRSLRMSFKVFVSYVTLNIIKFFL